MNKDKEDELVDSCVSVSQCSKAVSALVKHATKVAKQKEENELLPTEENVWLVLSVKKVTPEKKLKPFRIPLAHPIVDPRTSPICLITKDPQREYKDLLASHNIRFINRVLGVAKLKGKFKPFEARRMLMKENGLFLADERVVPLLPGLLGKIFFKAKKQPIPVSLTKKELKKELEQAVSSTYMHQNQGTCTSIKIGTISQSPAYILDNLRTTLPEIAKRITGGWENIQSLHIKTNSSTSLPIWTCNLGEGENGRWEGSKLITENDQSVAESDSDEEPAMKVDAKNEKKRAAGESDQPSNKKYKRPVEAKVEQSNAQATKPTSPVQKPKPSTKAISTEQVNGDRKGKKKQKGAWLVPSSDNAAVIEPKEKSKGIPGTSKTPDSKGPPKLPKKVDLTTSASEAQASQKQLSSKDSSAPSESTLSKEDIKKKRLLSKGLEKKKEKLAKKRLGGSIKESVIGKKSNSRI